MLVLPSWSVIVHVQPLLVCVCVCVCGGMKRPFHVTGPFVLCVGSPFHAILELVVVVDVVSVRVPVLTARRRRHSVGNAA